MIVLLAAAAAVAATPAYPALAAATPQCVPDGALPAANALVTGLENVGWIAGPGVLGLFLLAGQGPVVAVAAAVALFGAAALAAGGVGLPRPARTAGTGWHGELLAAARLVGGDPRLRRLLTVLVVDNLLYGYLVVLIVLLGTGPGSTGDSLGYLNTAFTAGALLAMPVVNRFAGTPFTLGIVMAGFGASLLLLGLSGMSAVAVALVGCAGAGTLIAEVIGVTMIQRATPESVHARVFGIYDQLAVGSVALGSLLAGPLADAVGSGPATVAVAVAGLLVVGAVALARSVRDPRDRPGPEPCRRNGRRTRTTPKTARLDAMRNRRPPGPTYIGSTPHGTGKGKAHERHTGLDAEPPGPGRAARGRPPAAACWPGCRTWRCASTG